MYEKLRKKTRMEGTEYQKENGELILIPRHKTDKKFPKAVIMKWQERNMNNTINDLRKRITLS